MMGLLALSPVVKQTENVTRPSYPSSSTLVVFQTRVGVIINILCFLIPLDQQSTQLEEFLTLHL